jgi:hypothetical protein
LEGGAPLGGEVFTVGETTLGYIYDFSELEHLKTGVGALVSVAWVPQALKPTLGSTPLSSMVFLRLRLQ